MDIHSKMKTIVEYEERLSPAQIRDRDHIFFILKVKESFLTTLV